MITLAGGLLALLGVLSGAALAASAFGLASAGLALWILFPLFTLLGWFLLVVSDVDPLRGTATRLVAMPLLVLAMLCALALVAGGAGLVHVQDAGGTLALSYVLVVAGVLGATGTAAYGRKPQLS